MRGRRHPFLKSLGQRRRRTPPSRSSSPPRQESADKGGVFGRFFPVFPSLVWPQKVGFEGGLARARPETAGESPKGHPEGRERGAKHEA